MSRCREFTEAERIERRRNGQRRLREHYGYRSEHEKQDAAGVTRSEQSSAALTRVRRLKRFARMCDAAAAMWLLDHGYRSTTLFNRKFRR